MQHYALLSGLFYDAAGELGIFHHVDPDELPEPFAALLNHDDHMTVTMEAFHGSLVSLKVLRDTITHNRYAREILLSRESDGEVVQYGIMQIDLDCLSAEMRQEIEAKQMPLGRILIRHNVLRHVELLKLWRVEAGPLA